MLVSIPAKVIEVLVILLLPASLHCINCAGDWACPTDNEKPLLDALFKDGDCDINSVPCGALRAHHVEHLHTPLRLMNCDPIQFGLLGQALTKQGLIDAHGDEIMELSVCYPNNCTGSSTPVRSIRFAEYLANMSKELPASVIEFEGKRLQSIRRTHCSDGATGPSEAGGNPLRQVRRIGCEMLNIIVGPQGVGVSFHKHQAVLQFVAYGKKLWFLSPPAEPPGVHLQLAEPMQRLQLIAKSRGSAKDILACVLYAGDVLLVPDSWAHATLSLSENVAVGASLGGAPKFRGTPLAGAASVRDLDYIFRLGIVGVVRELEPWARAWLKKSRKLYKNGVIASEEFEALVAYFKERCSPEALPKWLRSYTGKSEL